jgi:uncharacterized membrane protein YphA (DoxX/SURF4 family)
MEENMSATVNIGLLILRLVTGLLFAGYGAQKLIVASAWQHERRAA